GPMSFRLIVQPTVAVILAIRAGLLDAREGRPPFLWTLLTNADARRELLRGAWKDVGTVFLVALVLDAVYQIIVNSWIYPLEMLLTATILAFVPYVVLRGLVTRVARRRPAGTDAKGPPPGDRR